MITADQIIVHAVGDYVLQSDWMATFKTKKWLPAFCHALVYSLGFLVFRPSPAAWFVIFGTHYLIDRYRLARYVVWAKNFLAPKTWWTESREGEWTAASNQTAAMWRSWIDLNIPGIAPSELRGTLTMHRCRTPPFSACAGTGYPPDRPAWLAVWLLIFCDNLCHIVINAAALKWL